MRGSQRAQEAFPNSTKTLIIAPESPGGLLNRADDIRSALSLFELLEDSRKEILIRVAGDPG